jgi:two-component system, OmpR family, sensor kinase
VWQEGVRSGQLVARLLGRLSLQVRLVAAALCLLAAGAGVIGVASGLVARGYLMRQADQQLRAYAGLLTSRPFVATPISLLAPGAPSAGGSGGGAFSIQVRDSAGQLVMSEGPGARPGPAAAGIPARAGQLVTIAAGGGGSWRVIAEPVHYQAQRIPFAYSAEDFSVFVTSTARPGLAGTLVIGLDLASIGQAISRLTVTCLAVSSVVILTVACLGVVVIRTILRPLTQIQETAAAVAAGQRSRPVPDWHARGDTSGLAWSLNTMLSQIEHALNASAESEAAARRSGERLRRLIADTGHELRRPLSVIRGFADHYQQRGRLSAGELDRMMRRVADEAARMAVLIDDLRLTRHDQLRPPQRRGQQQTSRT